MNTRPPSPSAERTRRRGWRWLVAGAALAVMPKCLLCAVAYLGLGVALGADAPELCGAPAETAGLAAWQCLALGGAAGLAACAGWLARRARRGD
jgi:hypothetical protein